MTERPRSPLAMVVLAMLMEAPMHPYRIWELIKERGKEAVVNVAQRNSVYQTIDRLLRDGLIAVNATSRDEGRPERAVYELTESGERVLREWLEETLRERPREFPQFPAGLAFMMILPPKKALQALEQRGEAIETAVAADRDALAKVHAMGLPRLFLLDDEYKLAMAEAELAWVQALVADLKSGKVTWSRKMLREIAARFSP